MKSLIFAFIIILIFTCCEKEEPNVPLPDMGTVKNYKDSIPIPTLTVTP